MIIDWWTLGLQAVNVLILVWLLGRFFWRPVAGMIAARRAAIEQSLADAERSRADAAAALAEAEQARAGFAQEREAIIAAARAAAEEVRAERLAEAAKEAAALEESARATLETERDAIDRAWSERAGKLAVDIAERLLARLEGPVLGEAFLNWLVAEVRHLPEAIRETMTADGARLEAVSARPLGEAEQERCRALIGEALGATPQMAFTTDPALIAGLELRGPNLVIRNSWRADLDRIILDLAHADQR